MSRKKVLAVSALRCAIYTRKSTEEGLEQEFNSLDAQRDSGEVYIRSQQHEGWVCLSDHYDDGGFTGANMDRPALQRLLADIEDGKVNCVVVYKVDRLSRSLLDFSRIMEIFDRQNVSFVSVTQAFNTATSMGRLVLNVLLSFAQFEREMISERTRDKIAAARRKGKWSGGLPILGYSVVQTKLIVDEAEADRVRAIFEMYLERKSLLDVVKELKARNWRTKSWTTRKGTHRGALQFDKKRLYELLTNVTYIGKVRHKDEIYDGEHQAIVDAKVFAAARALLKRNGQSGTRPRRHKYGAILRGLLRCAACGCTMSPSFTSKGPRQYRYYVCQRAQKLGWDSCPTPSIPAGQIEQFVVDQIRGEGRDPHVIKETLAQVRRQADDQIDRLKAERKSLVEELNECQSAKLPAADEQSRVQEAEQRVAQIDHELAELTGEPVDEAAVAKSLADFDGTWASLSPREQTRIVGLLIEQVAYDGRAGNVSITFRPTGINTLATEFSSNAGDMA